MIRFLLLGIVLFSGVQSQGLKKCANNDVCVPNPNIAVDCHGDCMCRDNMADECGRPHPTSAIHVDTISDCMDNCKVFSLEGRCKFIIFHFDNIDENCIIMNDDFESYIGHCNQRGQPLWGPGEGEGLARWTGCKDAATCNNDGVPAKNTCNTCTDCSDSGCRGYILSECNVYSDFVESSPQTTMGHCEIWARTTLSGTYLRYNREQGECEVYGGVFDGNGAGFERECKVAIVELGTNPLDCQNVGPTVPPTTAPPDCTSDDQCKPGEICFDHICKRGCRSNSDCGVHPCSCTGECQDDIDPCHWCTATADKPEGQCAPGCGDNSDCVGDLVCNGQHMCVERGGTVLESITIFTKSCEGCAGTNEEVGAWLLMKGHPEDWSNTTCVIENLDHPDRVDYQAGVNPVFTSHDEELGSCNWANFNGHDMDMFTLTWNGQGKWNPSQFKLKFTGMTDSVTCPYVGAPFETGQSMTLNCKRD